VSLDTLFFHSRKIMILIFLANSSRQSMPIKVFFPQGD
jgi:hypothetical protein